MYLRITERCNMTCEHCCFSCTAKGRDMDLSTFRTAVGLAENYGMDITIGGGEPTLHKQFWEMLGLALAFNESEIQVLVVTNGKKSKDALRLARMGRNGIIYAALSLDEYHDRIDPTVIQAFTRKPRSYSYGDEHSTDYREIRTVVQISRMGRALDNGLGNMNRCACDDLVVQPDGDLWACGHLEEQFGTVDQPELPDFYLSGDYRCSRKRTAQEAA